LLFFFIFSFSVLLSGGNVRLKKIIPLDNNNIKTKTNPPKQKS